MYHIFKFLSLLFLEPITTSGFAKFIMNEDHLDKLVQVLQGLDFHQGVRVAGTDHRVLTRLARRASYQNMPSAKLSSLEMGQVWPIVYVSVSLADLDDFNDILTHQEYYSEELIFVTSYDFSLVRDNFRHFNASRAFLTYQLGQDSTVIHRIQTFRDRLLLLETTWTAASDDQKFEKKYDFEGAPMTLIATIYEFPYLIVVPCKDEPHLACQAFGSDMDTLKYLMAKYNFTLEIHLEPNNNFGMVPIQGSIGDANATYGGIFGHLLNDDYDRSSSAYQHTLDRNSMGEFSITCIYIKAHFVMDIGKAVKNDWTLYFRPFTQNLWNGCLLITSLTLCLYHLINFVSGRIEIIDSAYSSLKVIAFFGWMCYVMVKCYYDGALTMFFTTPEKLPFTTFAEGLSKYPKFELHAREGQEAFVYHAAMEGDPVIQAQVARMENNPDIIHETTLSLVKALTKPGAFALVNTGEVRAVLDAFPVEGLNLKKLFISRQDSGYYSIMYPKKSPWRSPLDNGYRELLSSGQMQHILDRWLPADLKSEEPDPKDQLGFRQIWLCFIILWGSQGLAITVLAIELIIRSGNMYRT